MSRDEIDHGGAARTLVETHEKSLPHHQPPCSFFLEHRATIYWVLGIVGALIAYFVVKTTEFQDASIKDRNEIRTDLRENQAKSDMQFKYLIDGMAELKIAMREMQIAHNTPTVGGTR